ncbi:hypothetical protein SPHINGOAX6_70350 [Sphingomonas sp. AX6]|nr:hypothetical protein SPHINGOAX6_70350 [Sphingomonas sp. AX6]
MDRDAGDNDRCNRGNAGISASELMAKMWRYRCQAMKFAVDVAALDVIAATSRRQFVRREHELCLGAST